jgi:hypothetical protein
MSSGTAARVKAPLGVDAWMSGIEHCGQLGEQALDSVVGLVWIVADNAEAIFLIVGQRVDHARNLYQVAAVVTNERIDLVR